MAAPASGAGDDTDCVSDSKSISHQPANERVLGPVLGDVQ